MARAKVRDGVPAEVEALNALFPRDEIEAVARETGLVKRAREIEPVAFFSMAA